MPLEDLTADGYEIQRPPEGEDILPSPAIVQGHGRVFYVQPDEDEEAIVAQARNHAKLADKMTTAQQYFSDNYANWSTMTNVQKDAANRNAQRALANLIRSVRDDLTSEGV